MVTLYISLCDYKHSAIKKVSRFYQSLRRSYVAGERNYRANTIDYREISLQW